LHSLGRRRRAIAARVRARSWRLLHRGISVGAGAKAGSGCRLIIDPHARIVLGAGCEIDDGTTLAAYDEARIVLGAGSFVGHRSTLAARRSIEIGARTFLAELVSIRDHDHRVGLPPSAGAMDVEAVVVGDDVWIGSKATVLRGARIGDGAVIGANAVARGEIPPRSVSVGVPARVVRSLTASDD
jgi:acetyltransferase-like isoleucine patch superfamily enzyme